MLFKSQLENLVIHRDKNCPEEKLFLRKCFWHQLDLGARLQQKTARTGNWKICCPHLWSSHIRHTHIHCKSL